VRFVSNVSRILIQSIMRVSILNIRTLCIESNNITVLGGTDWNFPANSGNRSWGATTSKYILKLYKMLQNFILTFYIECESNYY
jgi:hypothetical protein